MALLQLNMNLLEEVGECATSQSSGGYPSCWYGFVPESVWPRYEKLLREHGVEVEL
jgi:hypothetical protein